MGTFVNVVVVALSVGLLACWRALLKHSPIDPVPGALPPRPQAEGVFAHNNLLQRVEKIGMGQVLGPEDLALGSHGRIYTGCSDGWIKRIESDGEVVNWTFVGGRPLGLVMGLHGELLVCDAYQGLLNVTEGNVQVLSTEADGVKHKFADGLDVAKDGTIYFTDASDKFGFSDFFLDILEGHPHGRILRYDPSTGKTSVLLKGLFFPNGLALSQNQDFFVFCETAKARCRRYWLVGEKKGFVEDFVDSLPAFPDNIRSNKKGKFYVALAMTRSWFFDDFIMRYAFMRHILAHPKVAPAFFNSLPKASYVLVLSEEGKPLELYEDPNGKEVSQITSALKVGEYVYVGTLSSNFIARLKL